MDYDRTLEELNTTINDTDSVTFTPEQKGRALQKAWNDSYVVETVFDSSTVFTTSTWNYPVPTTLTTVKDIFMPRSSLDAPETITSEAYDVSGGEIRLNSYGHRIFTNGDVLTIKGNKKLDYETDTITSPSLQEYVIALAGYNTLTLLTFQKANLFLKNDTTMGELVTLRRELGNEVKDYRSRLEKSYESA